MKKLRTYLSRRVKRLSLKSSLSTGTGEKRIAVVGWATTAIQLRYQLIESIGAGHGVGVTGAYTESRRGSIANW